MNIISVSKAENGTERACKEKENIQETMSR